MLSSAAKPHFIARHAGDDLDLGAEVASTPLSLALNGSLRVPWQPSQNNRFLCFTKPLLHCLTSDEVPQRLAIVHPFEMGVKGLGLPNGLPHGRQAELIWAAAS